MQGGLRKTALIMRAPALPEVQKPVRFLLKISQRMNVSSVFPCRLAAITGAMLSAFWLASPVAASDRSTAGRVRGRDYPSVFQAWNPIDMTNQFSLATLEDRLKATAKHDLIWDEPVSQLGYKVDLVLGAVWDHPHGGLATDFTAESKRQALANRERMLEMNPNMVFLLEVRWRDAPGSFLPENSPFWKRNLDGSRKKGLFSGRKLPGASRQRTSSRKTMFGFISSMRSRLASAWRLLSAVKSVASPPCG